jgi:hypothetical protein
MKELRDRVKAAKEQRSAKAAGQVLEEETETSEGRKALLAARPIGKVNDDDYEYELPDDDDEPVVTHRRARLALMHGKAG